MHRGKQRETTFLSSLTYKHRYTHSYTLIHTHILFTSSWAYCEIVLATCSFLGTGHNNFWRSRSSQRRRRLKMPWRSLRGQGWDEEYGEGERVRSCGGKGSCEWVSMLPEATTQSNSKAAPRVPALNNNNNNNKSTHTNTNANTNTNKTYLFVDPRVFVDMQA